MSQLRILLAFFVRDLRVAASYRLQLFVQLSGVLTLSFTFFFLALMMRDVEASISGLAPYGGGYFGFALVGVAVSTYLDAALRSFSTTLRQAQMTGTLQAMLATGAPLASLVAGSALYPLFFTTVRVAVFFGFGALLGLPLAAARWGPAMLVLGLTVSVTLVLGVFAAGFVVRFKQGDPLTAGLAGLSWMFSGVVYPKEIFPEPIQAAALLLPMTHSLDGMRRALLAGASISDLQGSLTYLSVFTAVGLPLALVWFRWCVDGAKRTGSLAHY